MMDVNEVVGSYVGGLYVGMKDLNEVVGSYVGISLDSIVGDVLEVDAIPVDCSSASLGSS